MKDKNRFGKKGKKFSSSIMGANTEMPFKDIRQMAVNACKGALTEENFIKLYKFLGNIFDCQWGDILLGCTKNRTSLEAQKSNQEKAYARVIKTRGSFDRFTIKLVKGVEAWTIKSRILFFLCVLGVIACAVIDLFASHSVLFNVSSVVGDDSTAWAYACGGVVGGLLILEAGRCLQRAEEGKHRFNLILFKVGIVAFIVFVITLTYSSSIESPDLSFDLSVTDITVDSAINLLWPINISLIIGFACAGSLSSYGATVIASHHGRQKIKTENPQWIEHDEKAKKVKDEIDRLSDLIREIDSRLMFFKAEKENFLLRGKELLIAEHERLKRY